MGASTTGWTPAWDCAWSPGHLVAVVGLSPRLIRPKGGSGTQGSSIRVHGGHNAMVGMISGGTLGTKIAV